MIERTLIIKGQNFVYEDAQLTRNDARPITIEEGTKLLSTAQQLFNNVGINIYLAFGTLLGAVRDKTIISGDEDVDVFIDCEEEVYNNLPYFQENGLKLIRYTKGKIFSFRLESHAYIDVYVLRPVTGFNIWSLYCNYLNMNITPKKFFKEYQDIYFLGIKCKCPKNPEKLLEFWYGKTWDTPIRGHNIFLYCEPSAYYWRRKGYYIKKAIFKLVGKEYHKK